MEVLESSIQLISPPVVRKHHSSSRLSLILDQSHTYHASRGQKAEQLSAKRKAVKLHKQSDSVGAEELEGKLTNNMKRTKQVSTEKRASSWLATLPIDSLSTNLKVFSEVPSVYAMAGDLLIHHLTASVVTNSQLSTH